MKLYILIFGVFASFSCHVFAEPILAKTSNQQAWSCAAYCVAEYDKVEKINNRFVKSSGQTAADALEALSKECDQMALKNPDAGSRVLRQGNDEWNRTFNLGATIASSCAKN